MLALTLCIALPLVGICQPPDEEDPDAPIDGGISLLIIGGAVVGAKKIQEKRKKAKLDVNDTTSI